MADNVLAAAFKGRQFGAATPIDLDTDTIKIVLLNAAYFALSDSVRAGHDFRDDLASYEITGTGYTSGGIALTSKTLTLNGANYVFDAADPSWASATLTASGFALYKDVGSAATDPIIGSWKFSNAPVSSTAGAFSVAFDATGIVEIA